MESAAPKTEFIDSAPAHDSGWSIDPIPLLRIALASTLLAITYSARILAGLNVSLLDIAIGAYTLSGVLYCLPLRSKLWRSVRSQSHWLDVGWFGLFLALGKGLSVILWPGFLFAIIVASRSRNKSIALRVAVVSLSLVLIDLILDPGFVPVPGWGAVESRSHLLLYAVLLLIGFALVRRGNLESLLSRRLGLMKNVMALSNPRFGVDRTICSAMEQVRAFYSAEACVLVMNDPVSKKYELRRADCSDKERALRSEEISADLARQFLGGFGTRSALYARGLLGGYKIYGVPEADGGRSESDAAQRCEELATLLDAESFITVPVVCHGETSGRLFIAARGQRVFTKSDTDFLCQVLQNVLPVIENIRLVDRLASDAADQERQRIARDIHDSVIQPYIGIQMGLGAVRLKLAGGKSDVNHDVERLIEMTQLEIHGLRHYVGGLAQSPQQKGGLLQSLKRFTEKFTGATGIAVEIETESEIRVNDRLAAEVFQLVAEGLSNIRRHTQAPRGRITMGCRRGHFHLRIGNETEGADSTGPFIPKSITARTLSLGGRVDVETTIEGWTYLNIEIPL